MKPDMNRGRAGTGTIPVVSTEYRDLKQRGL